MDDHEIVNRLARIETKLDLLMEDRNRLASVERKQWLHSGGVVALTFILSKVGIPLPH